MGNLLGGSGGGSQQSTSTQALDPKIRDAYLQNLERAQGVAGNLGAQQFAPRTGDYMAGENIARQTALNGPGLGTTDLAASTANRLQNAGPMYINAPTASAALTGSTGYGAERAGATGYNPLYGGAAQLSGADIANYQSPYTQQVIDTTLADLNRSRQMTLNENAGQAVRAGAFGGSRQAVQNALTNEGFGRTAASTVAGLRNTGYQNALTAAQADVANRQAMGLANLGYGNQAAQFGAGAANTAALANQAAANQAAQFGAGAANQAALSNQAAQNQMAQLNANLGFNASTANQAAYQNALNQQLQAANLGGTLGAQQQALRFGAASNLTNLGLANQQFNQQQLDAIRNLPLEQQALINQALGLNPAGGAGNVGTSTSSGSSSQGTGIMGLFR